MTNNMLVILNYQREIPPFMINEIGVAKDIFDEIIYITPKMYKDNSITVDYPNVVVCAGSNLDKIIDLLQLPFSLLNIRMLREISKAFRWGRISGTFIKKTLEFIGASHFLVRKAEKIIVKNKNKKIYVLAAWMNSEAYAAAILKKKHKYLYAATLAHSFEVNPLRDKNVDLHMNEFVHYFLDNINFISTEVYDEYNAYVMKKYCLDNNNITCIHLGCRKLFNTLNEQSSDGIFRILSCSTVLPNKRLDRLLNVLKEWKCSKIVWTHIGDGECFNEITQKSYNVMKNNQLLKVELLGYKSNEEVQKFYAENKIDLFVNISEIEGVPVSIMESMAYGVPVVASDVGGNKEIVNSSNGFLIPMDFTDEYLYDVLKIYYEMEQSKKQLYRENAFNQWAANFDGYKNINIRYRTMLKMGELRK